MGSARGALIIHAFPNPATLGQNFLTRSGAYGALLLLLIISGVNLLTCHLAAAAAATGLNQIFYYSRAVSAPKRLRANTLWGLAGAKLRSSPTPQL